MRTIEIRNLPSRMIISEINGFAYHVLGIVSEGSMAKRILLSLQCNAENDRRPGLYVNVSQNKIQVRSKQYLMSTPFSYPVCAEILSAPCKSFMSRRRSKAQENVNDFLKHVSFPTNH
jgi:hypothetical protein